MGANWGRSQRLQMFGGASRQENGNACRTSQFTGEKDTCRPQDLILFEISNGVSDSYDVTYWLGSSFDYLT